MTDQRDEFDEFAAALRAATPAPDAGHRAAVLKSAGQNFQNFAPGVQGSRPGERLTSDRPKKGFVRGVATMLSGFFKGPALGLSRRAALGASTAVAVVGTVAVVGLGEVNLPVWGDFARTEVLENASVTGDTPDAAEAQAALGMAQSDQTASYVSEPPIILEEIAAPTAPMLSKQARPMQGGIRLSGAAEMGTLSEAPADMQFHTDLDVDFRSLDANTEAYPEAETNPLKITAQTPVSTFSIDVDTAGYGVLRNMLEWGQLPQPDTVRIEEMINYFPYDYAAPENDRPFSVALASMPTPWNAGTRLVRIGLQGALPEVDNRPPLNLVFLIDTSGSMEDPNKLPLLKQSFALMLTQLRPEDEVAIVTYAGSAGEVLEPTPASERATILGALDRLDAGGATAGQAGLQQAYSVAERMQNDGEVSRILLATDGDFNVGLSDTEALKRYVADKRDTGTYLSVLGFGRGNLDDATMQVLAQNGNGTAAYIDTLSEAQKVLVDQLSGALFPIADDVKVQVEWNPAQVAEYRLIGYETRALRREDFNNDRVDAGEIGAGHQVTALYEITPVGSEARLTEPLRYGEATIAPISEELGFLRLRYKSPGAEVSELIEAPIARDLPQDAELQFAAAIAGFGQLLRDAPYLNNWTWDDAIALGTAARGDDSFGYRSEAVRLMRLAKTLNE